VPGSAVVHVLGGERTELEEGAAGVAQAIDPLPWEQLAPLDVPRPGALPAPLRGLGLTLVQIRNEPGMRLGVRLELRRPRSRMRVQHRAHAASSELWSSVRP
jgi:hypothetical protein